MCRKSLALLTLLCMLTIRPDAITCARINGRLGDQLVHYIHAKWLSYTFGMPFFYRPFAYSDNLVLHRREVPLITAGKFAKTRTFEPGQPPRIASQSDTLYLLDYFPENSDELRYSRSRYCAFDVNWDDERFMSNIRDLIKPIRATKLVELRRGRINIALHVRKGGGYDFTADSSGGDGMHRADIACPSKFPADSFYIEQIRAIWQFLGKRALSVFIFTDDKNPVAIKWAYEQAAQLSNVEFRCRDVNDQATVLDDFFSIKQFGIVIRSESNFSIVAAKLGRPILEMWPEQCKYKDGVWTCGHVSTAVRIDQITKITTWPEFVDSSVANSIYQALARPPHVKVSKPVLSQRVR